MRTSYEEPMNDIAIRCEGLSKQYRIGERESYKALRDVITDAAAAPFRRVRAALNSGNESMNSYSNGGGTENRDPRSDIRNTFWALSDVSFEVKRGEVVGIIGRNGAGKSTLLKVLSRITKPTRGHAEIHGRVGSLLEVGTGFHPELTGRENIFLNAAILGMRKAEVERKFDEIVAFAEVEQFIDTPVKRYSSGMYVRLAFAVAAHMETEVLIVDEVLAVGDAQFQKKCLGKMKEVGDAGRAVLFVSHNMSVVQALCQRGIVLQRGRVITDKPVGAAVHTYLRDTSSADSFTRPEQPNGKPTLTSGRLAIFNQPSVAEVVVDTEITSLQKRRVSVDVRLTDALGIPVGFGSLGALNANESVNLQPGVNKISFAIPISQLAVGSYFIGLDLTLPDSEYYDRLDNCFAFEVVRPPENPESRVMTQLWGYGSFEIALKVRNGS